MLHSEGVKSLLAERERLAKQRRELRRKQREMEEELLRLQSEHDFERKMNELGALRT